MVLFENIILVSIYLYLPKIKEATRVTSLNNYFSREKRSNLSLFSFIYLLWKLKNNQLW